MRKKTVELSQKNQLIIQVVFVGLAILLPLFIHRQFITGPQINALLFLSTVWFGTGEAIFLGLLPSTVALSSGLLPLTFAPLVPFVMLGNALLVLSFNRLYQRNFHGAIIISSGIKFVFLFAVAHLLLPIFLPAQTVQTTVELFSWGQLLTALVGGYLAFFILRFFKKND